VVTRLRRQGEPEADQQIGIVGTKRTHREGVRMEQGP
jgi:hypothetical protein